MFEKQDNKVLIEIPLNSEVKNTNSKQPTQTGENKQIMFHKYDISVLHKKGCTMSILCMITIFNPTPSKIYDRPLTN